MQEITIYSAPRRLKKRQSAFQRNPHAQVFQVLTPRLLEILNWLSQLLYLTTDQIARFFYLLGSRKYAERQLRRLYDGGFINRIPTPTARRWGNSTLLSGGMRTLHYLDGKGKRYLKQAGIVTNSISKRPSYSRLGLNILEHTLAVNEFLLTVYKATMQHCGKFDIVRSEVGYQRGNIEPDSIFRLVFPETGLGMCCLVEVDRGTESIKRIKEKIVRYRRLYESGEYFQRFQTTSCRVLFVVADYRSFTIQPPSTKREWEKQIQKRCEALNKWIMEDNNHHDLFWIAPLYALTSKTLFHAPIWQHGSVVVPLINDYEGDI